jgi:hypothetical protein
MTSGGAATSSGARGVATGDRRGRRNQSRIASSVFGSSSLIVSKRQALEHYKPPMFYKTLN